MSQSVIISNLPLTCNSYEISNLFGEVGLIKRSFLIRNESKEFTGTAQVTYHTAADAAEAVKRLHNSKYKTKEIFVKISEEESTTENVINNKLKKRSRRDGDDGAVLNAGEISPKKRKTECNTLDSPLIQEERYHKDQLGRVIVRNVSFKATEEDIHNFFARFGSISEINIPKRNAAKNILKGCVFIQFEAEQNAVDAIKGANLQKFLGRYIAVDHAIPKGKYQQAVKSTTLDIKKESNDADELPVITVADDGEPLPPVTEEGHINSSNIVLPDRIKKEELSDSDEEEEDEIDTDDAANKTESSSTEKSSTKKVKQDGAAPIDHKATSRDVEEGRTLFLSKLAIDTTAFSVETVLSSFGEVKYVVLVMDKLTEQSRGTAFAQFKSREAAEGCLAAAEDPSRQHEVTVDGRVMQVRRALGRGEAQEQRQGFKTKQPQGKDNRNLYLAKEGFIREGTHAAQGVSAHDLQLRRAREVVKQKLLSNLHMFVSPTRLCINNLPQTLADPQLRQLLKKHAPDKARITESRIMRYLGEVDANGVARSRGYGFVSFTRHEDALGTLRAINNNPEVFSHYRRPIVEFSIENRAVLNIKKKRLRNSKDKLNKSKKVEKKASKTGALVSDKVVKVTDKTVTSGASRPSFAGYGAKRGDIKSGKKIHKHLGAKIRHRDTKGKGSKGSKFQKGSTGKKSSSLKKKR